MDSDFIRAAATQLGPYMIASSPERRANNTRPTTARDDYGLAFHERNPEKTPC